MCVRERVWDIYFTLKSFLLSSSFSGKNFWGNYTCSLDLCPQTGISVIEAEEKGKKKALHYSIED